MRAAEERYTVAKPEGSEHLTEDGLVHGERAYEGRSLPKRCIGVSRPWHGQFASLTVPGHGRGVAEASSAMKDGVLLFSALSQRTSKAAAGARSETSVSPMTLLTGRPLLREPSVTGLSSIGSGPVTMSVMERQVSSHDGAASCFFSRIVASTFQRAPFSQADTASEHRPLAPVVYPTTL